MPQITEQKLRLDKTTHSRAYTWAIMAVCFYLQDNIKECAHSKGDTVSTFMDNNRAGLKQLHDFFLTEFKYELSDLQMAKGIATFLTFTYHKTTIT